MKHNITVALMAFAFFAHLGWAQSDEKRELQKIKDTSKLHDALLLFGEFDSVTGTTFTPGPNTNAADIEAVQVAPQAAIKLLNKGTALPEVVAQVGIKYPRVTLTFMPHNKPSINEITTLLGPAISTEKGADGVENWHKYETFHFGVSDGKVIAVRAIPPIQEQLQESPTPAIPKSTWENDWTAFVQELAKEAAKDNDYKNNVNTAFLGKSVEWTGTVTEMERPTGDPTSGRVRLSMKPAKLVLKSGNPTLDNMLLDSLLLKPNGDEWNTWEAVSVGDTVAFRTTLALDRAPFPPTCVLAIMKGFGGNAGKFTGWINTKGGVRLKAKPTGTDNASAPKREDAKDVVTEEQVAEWRRDAERGNAFAQFNLGVCYKEGEAVPKNQEEAVKWYRKAAVQGNDRAQFNLGNSYYKGEGVPIDRSEAVKWFRKAADQGDAGAQHSLGVCYARGEGVPKDAAKAVKWYRKAADQGLADAQINLGNCYVEGEGVAKDQAEGVKWCGKAAEQGDAAAQFNLGTSYAKGEGIPKDQAEAVKWYRKAADQGHAVAQFNLGVYYSNGAGVPKDRAEAVKWYRKAADQGNVKAQYNLGNCYTYGEGVPKDLAEAVKWFRKAADQGEAHAQYNLGGYYSDGEGVPMDAVMAYMWLNLSAAGGVSDATKNREIIARSMTPEQISKAKKLSREWKPKKPNPKSEDGKTEQERAAQEREAQSATEKRQTEDAAKLAEKQRLSDQTRTASSGNKATKDQSLVEHLDPRGISDSSYAFGLSSGSTFLQQFSRFGVTEDDIQQDSLIKGFMVAVQGNKPELSDEKLQTAMQTLGDLLQARKKKTAGTKIDHISATVKSDSSYGFGFQSGSKFRQQFGRFGVTADDVQQDSFIKGFMVAVKGDKSELSEKKCLAAMQSLGDLLQTREQAAAAANLKAGEEFLKKNEERKEITTTKSGLQYEVLAKGGEEKYVAPQDPANCNKQFMVNYKGTLISGKQFDASPAGEPVPMTLQVIEGFKEALTTMPVGAKWRLFMPSNLAYGAERRNTDIGPCSALIFELELVKIHDAAPTSSGPSEATPSAPLSDKPDVDPDVLKHLQGEWVVEKWTGYKPLAMYDGYMAISKGNDYSGSRLRVTGTNTTWQLKVTEKMEGLLLGLFLEGKDLITKKEGKISFYTDKASIVELQNGSPGKLRFSAVSGKSAKAQIYAAIWSLQEDRLVVCKAKNAGDKCSQSLEIPADDFSNTRIVLRRVKRTK